MEAGNPDQVPLTNGNNSTASELFNRQVDVQRYDFLNERVIHLQAENEHLKERHDKREQETHEFVAYFQKEIHTRDKQITKLTEEIVNLKMTHTKEMDFYSQQKENEIVQLHTNFTTKEEKFNEQILFLKEELNQLEMFNEMKEMVSTKMKDLEVSLQKEKETNKELINGLERKFLEEKARLQKEHEKKIEQVKQQAKEDARNGLDADTRKIVTDNRRMGEELRFQLQITEELQKEKDFFQQTMKNFQMDLQLSKEKEQEFALKTQKQTREIKELHLNLKEMEKKMSQQFMKLEKNKQNESIKKEKEMEEMQLDTEGLRRLLKLKNKELRNMRRLAQTILDQRSDVEQFFLDALDQVKKQIEYERKKAKQDEMERYRQELKKANNKNLIGTNTRFPQLKSPAPPSPSGTSNTKSGGVSTNRHFSERVDLRDLTWEDRERVLRLLFAKINGMQSYADTTSDDQDEFHEGDNEQEDKGVFFPTEPASGPMMALGGLLPMNSSS